MRELIDGGARYGDMAVLLTAWGSLETYESALRAENIPTYALLAEGFYERREVWDLLLALETLRDPRDDRALLGFLRSPFVGVRDETLLDVVRQTERPVWGRIREAKVAEQELLDFGIRLVDEHARLRDRVPMHELLAGLLERSGYTAHLVALGEAGRQPLANVRKFLRLAREFRDGNVGDFLRACREARKREEPEADERLYGQRENVVTITSVHSAKGLQWPIVFWADLAREPRAVGREPILIGRELVALKDPDEEEQGAEWTDLLAREGDEAAAEHKRLWYVAATRARDRLILSGFSDSTRLKEGCAAVVARRGARPRRARRATRSSTGTPRGRRSRPACSACRWPSCLKRRRSPLRLHPSPRRSSRSACRPAAPATRRPSSCPSPAAPAGTGSSTSPASASRRSAVRGPSGAAPSRAAWWCTTCSSGSARRRSSTSCSRRRSGAGTRRRPRRTRSRGGSTARRSRARSTRSGRIRPTASWTTRPAAGASSSSSTWPGRTTFSRARSTSPRRRDGGIAALDVKTGGGDAEALKRKADGYALQRSVYVGALEAIGGRPVTSFAFHFAADGVQIGGPVTAEMRAEAAEGRAAGAGGDGRGRAGAHEVSGGVSVLRVQEGAVVRGGQALEELRPRSSSTEAACHPPPPTISYQETAP